MQVIVKYREGIKERWSQTKTQSFHLEDMGMYDVKMGGLKSDCYEWLFKTIMDDLILNRSKRDDDNISIEILEIEICHHEIVTDR